jgi:hypothetical protein
MKTEPSTESGQACAAVLAVGIGLCGFGIVVCASEASKAVAAALTLYKPTGPLSGKVALGVAIWLVAWALLGRMWKGRDMALKTPMRLSLVLIAIGLLLSFPPVMDAFH